MGNEAVYDATVLWDSGLLEGDAAIVTKFCFR